MSTSIRFLRVWLHRRDLSRTSVGYLSQFGDVLRMSFDDAYVADADRPTLSLSYRGATAADTRAILTALLDTRMVRNDGRLPVWFSNLLPEGHNRDRLAEERRCERDDEFQLLAAAGHDLMGAIEVEPVPPSEGVPDAVGRWHASQGVPLLEPDFVEMPVEDAASLPGVVTKFSAILDGRRYVVKRHGQAGSVILKLPSVRHPDLVANEFAGYRLCKALGLDCATAQVVSRADADLPEDLPFNDILAVSRFDRGPGGRRIHMEEFAQALQYAPRHKYGKDMVKDYSTMIQVLDRYSARPASDVAEFVGRFVAFVLFGNTDAHLKNWALIYPDEHAPVLSPLYDPVCVSAFFRSAPPGDYGINRTIDKRLRAFGWNELEALLKSSGLLRPGVLVRKMRRLVDDARAQWPALLDDAPGDVRDEVLSRLAGGVALAR